MKIYSVQVKIQTNLPILTAIPYKMGFFATVKRESTLQRRDLDHPNPESQGHPRIRCLRRFL
jgi:hypothetical protein